MFDIKKLKDANFTSISRANIRVTSCPKTPAAERKNKTQENRFWVDIKGEHRITISSSVTGVP